jgi:hypothetical protein
VYDDTKIKLWERSNKTRKIDSDKTEFDISKDTIIYVEGLTPHENTTGDIVKLKYVWNDKVSYEDKVKIIVANMIIALSGHGQTGIGTLRDYLDGVKKDNRTNTRIVKGRTQISSMTDTPTTAWDPPFQQVTQALPDS